RCVHVRIPTLFPYSTLFRSYSAARGIFLRSAVISLLLASVLAPILVGCSPAVSSRARAPERPRNVILMIADGTGPASTTMARDRSEEHTSELQSRENLVCRL